MRIISCCSSATWSCSGARGSLPLGTEFCREGYLRVHTVSWCSSATGSCAGARGSPPLRTWFCGEVCLRVRTMPYHSSGTGSRFAAGAIVGKFVLVCVQWLLFLQRRKVGLVRSVVVSVGDFPWRFVLSSHFFQLIYNRTSSIGLLPAWEDASNSSSSPYE